MTTILEEETKDPEDLSFVADALLALCAKERDAPYFTEDGFEARRMRLHRRESIPSGEMISGRLDSLLGIECRDVLAEARLTTRQRDVLDLRLEGFTFEEIGALAHITKQAVRNAFIGALKKITRTFREYPYAGLSEVYRSEVKRRSRFGTMGR